jgi:hypothetical protein
MLAAYYDVRTKDSFEEIFGKLDIGKAPTESRNSHLVLLFDFSTITPSGSREDVERRIFLNISRTLRDFLLKYGDILQHPSPEEYITPGSIEDSLTSVLVSTLLVVFFSSPEDYERASFVGEATRLLLASMSMMLLPTLV